MGMTARVSLPGYNAGTDTNLDHYSLYADVDNVLIKRQSQGSVTLPVAGTSGATIGTYAHNLGYIPFFLAYTDYGAGTSWNILNNQYNLFSVPQAISGADGTNLYLVNFNGAGTSNYQYSIFYDAMSSGTPSFTQSSQVMKITRPGIDGTSTNPNNYIMHSDLNNFKIIKQGTASFNFTNGTTITIPHSGSITNPVQHLVYFSGPNTNPTLTGAAVTSVQNGTYRLASWADTTNIYINTFNLSGTLTGTISYYLFGKGIDIPQTHGQKLLISSPGIDAGTATNPDNFNFHSDYATLKYYTSGSYTMSNITSTTTGTIAHNLGYTPFFIGFVNDLQGFLPNAYAIMPYYLGKSSVFTPNADVGAFMYADSTNIYLRAWFDTSASGTYNFTFYYKIFKNNLGL